ncbi:MAG: asparagine synthase (glutamine-hydrolyzing) [Anaerolineales bacterium]|nr:asparagine synthase (glutamine-hydrolyzing) [Anaerolineales bacterium]
MCGINGFTWGDTELIKRMNYLARFRGPDGSGTYVDEAVSLGSTRLAIIDLSERGNQPMSTPDGRFWIVFNGEIYNYKSIRERLVKAGHEFKSDSDTEVILHAYQEYGDECFELFNGMWGLALYDQQEGELLLCRDRFGVKPLYFHTEGTRLIFSSMLGAFPECGVVSKPDEQIIMEYLAFNLTQHNDRTFFTNIYSLLPGHMLRFKLASGEYKISQWYTPTPRRAQDSAELRRIFTEAVKWRTVSDVPVGVCLSGGIDSSAITCILDRALPSEFNAFSLVAPGSSVDESKYIDEVVRYTGAKPHYTSVDPKTFMDDVADFVAAMEEPVTGLSAYAQYRVFKLAHENGARVLLDGQGGDELFGGYVYYWGYYFLELFKRGKWGSLVKNMILGLTKFKQLFPYALFLFLLLPHSLRDFLWRSRITPWVDHAYLQSVCGDQMDPRWQAKPLREVLNLTLFSTSIPHNLMWGDKSSMRWSVECREPFMDYELVHAAMAMVAEELLADGETKVAFREAIREDLPDLIYNRKDKVGFEAPEDEFFADPEVISFAEDLIYSESFKNRPYWNWEAVERIFSAHKAGRKKSGALIWKWVNLELWLREFFDEGDRRAPVRQSMLSQQPVALASS